jgi:hypothetical protein
MPMQVYFHEVHRTGLAIKQATGWKFLRRATRVPDRRDNASANIIIVFTSNLSSDWCSETEPLQPNMARLVRCAALVFALA